MPLHVSNHPLVADSLAGLRDTSTPPEEFRSLARKLITMLLYEATADLPAWWGGEKRRGPTSPHGGEAKSTP